MKYHQNAIQQRDMPPASRQGQSFALAEMMRIAIWILSLLVAFAAGWRMGQRNSNEFQQSPAGSPASVSTKTAGIRSRSPSVWGQRLRDRDPAVPRDVWAEIPTDQRGAALKAWIESYGLGGPTGGDLSEIRAALDRWAEEDFDAAWNWATSSHDPAIREMAMTGLAASIASSDPDKAFECLVSHGEFGREMDDYRLLLLIVNLGKKAAADSPEALKQLLSRLPAVTSAVSMTSGDNLELPEDADFAAYLDVLREDREQSSKPVYLCGVMEKWAKQDEAAATGYLLDRGETVPVHSEWGDVMRVIKDANGQAAADRWMIETFREVPVEKRGVFFKNANYLRSPERILDLDPGLFAEGERAEFAAGLLEGMAASEIDFQALLKKVPATDWIPALENVRGMTATGALESYLRSGGISDDEVARISGVVRQSR